MNRFLTALLALTLIVSTDSFAASKKRKKSGGKKAKHARVVKKTRSAHAHKKGKTN